MGQKEWRERNAETIAVNVAAYYRRNRSKILAWAAEYRAKTDPVKNAEYQRAHYLKNQEKKRAYAKSRRLAKRDHIRNANNKRKAAQRGSAVNDFTGAQWTAMKEAYGQRCAYCGCVPDKLTQDHVIALARGGNHTASNIVPACMPCNNRKKVKQAPPFVVVPHYAASANPTISEISN